MASDDNVLDLDSTFPEPERPPTPDPTFAIYEDKNPLSEPRNMKIRLVVTHPLWAHHPRNASRSFALLSDATKFRENRTVLELGAGGALPSIVAVLSGASKVVVTDYPDAPLIEDIRFNIAENVPPSS